MGSEWAGVAKLFRAYELRFVCGLFARWAAHLDGQLMITRRSEDAYELRLVCGHLSEKATDLTELVCPEKLCNSRAAPITWSCYLNFVQMCSTS